MGDTKSTLRNDGGREENAMIKIGNNNKHGTWSCGQRISNSTLTCHVELLFFLPHLQPPSSSSQPPSSSSSTSIIIPQASLGWLGVTQQWWTLAFIVSFTDLVSVMLMRRCVSARANKNNSKHRCSGAQATVVLNQTQNGGNQHARCLWGRNADTAD